MYTPEREWKPVRCWKLYKWDKPKGERAMDIKKEVVQCPDPENHKSHTNKETHIFCPLKIEQHQFNLENQN